MGQKFPNGVPWTVTWWGQEKRSGTRDICNAGESHGHRAKWHCTESPTPVMSLVRAQAGNAWFLLCLVGDGLPCVSHFYVWQAGACLPLLWTIFSRMFLQGTGLEETESLDHRAGKLTAPYTNLCSLHSGLFCHNAPHSVTSYHLPWLSRHYPVASGLGNTVPLRWYPCCLLGYEEARTLSLIREFLCLHPWNGQVNRSA